MPKLTYDKLLEKLPLLNARELELRSNVRVGKLYDCRVGRATLSDEELDRINKTLRTL